MFHVTETTVSTFPSYDKKFEIRIGNKHQATKADISAHIDPGTLIHREREKMWGGVQASLKL